MRMLVFGHGYSAGFLTPLLRARGWHVAGTTRADPDRVAAAGAVPILWPGDEARLRQEIAGAKRLERTADDLETAARAWRAGSLD